MRKRAALTIELIVAGSGIGLGYIEYRILRPEPLIDSWQLTSLLPAALILIVATGFVEEFLFRGILQTTATRLYGDLLGIGYVSLVFGVLHIGHLSVIDVFFVTAVAIYFSLVVRYTGSLFGVSLAHGLTNITLFVFMPLIA